MRRPASPQTMQPSLSRPINDRYRLYKSDPNANTDMVAVRQEVLIRSVRIVSCPAINSPLSFNLGYNGSDESLTLGGGLEQCLSESHLISRSWGGVLAFGACAFRF